MLSYDVIIADDVRLEMSGKQTIVGMYAELMYVPVFPFFLPQMVFLPIISGKGEIPERVRFSVIISESDKIEAEAVMTEDDGDDRWRTIIFPPMFARSLEIKEETQIIIQMFADGDLVADKKFSIMLNPNPQPDAPSTDINK